MERATCKGILRGLLRRRSRICRLQRGSIRLRRCERGAAIVEAAVALPILLVVILGSIQFGLIYEAKATLNHAALQAARAGAVGNAEPNAVRQGLARGLVPLHSPGSSLQDFAGTVARLKAQLLTDAQIRILNPTREAFEDFAVEAGGHREIPNDRLHTRSTQAGARSGLNIQDANLLRVKVTYGYELKVPLVNWFISRTLLSLRRSFGRAGAFEQQLLARTLLPIVATSTVRMQSPARLSDLIVGQGEFPKVGRVPSNGPAPPASDPNDELEEPEETESDRGSNLADGFLGYGSGSSPAGGATPGTGGGNEGGGNEGGGNGGNPSACADESGSSDASIPGTGAPSLGVGNPIHVGTGNKYQAETDLAPLPGLLGIAFTRHYNSEAAGHAGAIGSGWRHSYEASVRAAADGSSIDLWQADGRHLTFRRADDTETFTAQRGSDGTVLRDVVGYLWRWPSGRELRFDPQGRLVSLREGVGMLALRYDEAGRLMSVSDAQRRTLSFDYYANGRVSRVRAAAGATWRYLYDERGNLSQVISADGTARAYAYADARHPHHLTAISVGTVRPLRYGDASRFEPVARWEYDAEGRAVLSSHPGDAGKVTLRYRQAYTEVMDAFGRTSRYVLTRRDGIVLVAQVRGPGCGDCGGGDVGYTYNEYFQLTEVAPKDRPSLIYRYDDQRRLVSIERTLGATRQWLVRYSYSAAALPTRIEFPSVKPGAVHAFELDYDDGRILALREQGYSPVQEGFDAIERTFRFSHDAQGKLAEIHGPREDVRDVTRFEHDSLGRLIEARAADAIYQRVSEYDAAGRPVRIEQTGKPHLRLEYDIAGRIVAVSELRAGTTQTSRLAYDKMGRLREMIAPDGTVGRIRYNAAGQPERYIDEASGRSMALAYAPDGKPTAAAVLSREIPIHILHYAYDLQRRLIEVRDGEGPPLRQFEYIDNREAPARITDAMGVTTRLDYDITGGLSSVLVGGVGPIRLARDIAGRVAAVTAANEAETRYEYDDFARRVREQSADRGVTTYAYDAADNLKERTDARGEKTTFFYDAANRLVRVERREGTTQLRYERAYLAEISGPATQERFGHDANGQLIEHTRVIRGHSFTTRYRYRPDGRLAQRTLPSGRKLSYRYSSGTAAPIVAEEGLFNDVELPNDRSESPGSAALGRTRDDAGRIADIGTGSVRRSYRYDALGRLIWARTPLGDFKYRYDANGNRLSGAVGLSGERYAYAPRSNRLLSVKGLRDSTYSYDAAGHPSRIASLRYEYDSSGRTSHLYSNDRLIAAYSYGPSGDRISKTEYARGKSRSTLYLYEDHRLVAEADEQGHVTREYLYRGQRPVAVLERGEVYRVHTDHLGAPFAMTDSKRRVVWSAQYEPFGNARVDEDPDRDGIRLTLNLRFPGQYADAESGTYYNILRDYDPSTGRYLTSDPIGLAGGLNSYAYAAQDPVNAIDPLGLYLFAFDGTWINRTSGTLTNVELFRRYYDPSFNSISSFYRRGLGTQDPRQGDFLNSVDRVLGGAFGLGGQVILNEALQLLDGLIRGGTDVPPFDGVIDLVGFSRGAALARAFANKIYELVDSGYYRDALRADGMCRSLRIRFMGLFDTVGAFGIPGDSVDTGYDFSIDDRIGTVAHAIALDEHRAAFDLISIQNAEASPNTTAYREERGFIGGHSDIGGGYSTGDLSDIALQWMYKKAVAAGVTLTPLSDEHRLVTAPIVHDERTFAQDREIFYPNDPSWRPATCTGNPIRCLFWEPPATQRQSTAPQFQFPELAGMIRENPQPGGVRGTVDMQRYRSWLRNRGQL